MHWYHRSLFGALACGPFITVIEAVVGIHFPGYAAVNMSAALRH